VLRTRQTNRLLNGPQLNAVLGGMRRHSVFLLAVMLLSKVDGALANDSRSEFDALQRILESAYAAQNSGDYVAAERDHKEALEKMRTLGAPPGEIALQSSNLSSALNRIGKPELAEIYAREAQSILSTTRTRDPIQYAAMMGNLAESLRLQGKLHEAKRYFEDELGILSKEGALNTHFAASAWCGLAEIAASNGDAAKAIKLYERAIPILLTVGDSTHPVISQYIKNLESLKSEISNSN